MPDDVVIYHKRDNLYVKMFKHSRGWIVDVKMDGKHAQRPFHYKVDARSEFDRLQVESWVEIDVFFERYKVE